MKKFIMGMLATVFLSMGMTFGSEPTIVVIDSKLVKAESVLDPKIKITTPMGPVDLVKSLFCKLKFLVICQRM